VKIWTSQNPRTAARQKTLVNSCPRSQQRKAEDQRLEKVFELLTARSNQAINDECHHSRNTTTTKLRTYSDTVKCAIQNEIMGAFLNATGGFCEHLCHIQLHLLKPLQAKFPSKGKGHPCTGTEAMYRPYGPWGE